VIRISDIRSIRRGSSRLSYLLRILSFYVHNEKVATYIELAALIIYAIMQVYRDHSPCCNGGFKRYL
jgi:hypothetical protein